MTNLNPKQPLTVKLPNGLKAKLAAWADRENLTLSAHVRRLLIRDVEQYQENKK